MIVAGVDGCRGGWFCVSRDLSTGAVSSGIFASISQLLARHPHPAFLAVDIPIGMTESGPRTEGGWERSRGISTPAYVKSTRF